MIRQKLSELVDIMMEMYGTFSRKRPQLEKMMPLGVVLTIPATGSEASNTTVVTNSENGHMKRALSHECLRPDFALMILN